jgi:hypothetical protein
MMLVKHHAAVQSDKVWSLYQIPIYIVEMHIGFVPYNLLPKSHMVHALLLWYIQIVEFWTNASMALTHILTEKLNIWRI